MQEVTLVAESGRALGSRPSRRLRAAGKVPGVVYGRGGEARTLAVDWHDLRAALARAGGHALVNLKLDGTETLAIVQEIQRDPVRLRVDHVDFLEVDPEAEISVEVPIVLHGTAEQVRKFGGVVEQTVSSTWVRTTPRNIPQELSADVTRMEIDQMLHLADLDVPPGLEVALDPEEPIAVARKSRLVRALEREAAEAELEVEEGAERAAEEATEGGGGQQPAGGGEEAASDEA